MSILKFENRTPRSLLDMYNYLVDDKKTSANGIFGIGLNPYNAVAEMEFVQLIYHKEIMHPYIQIIFAFDVGISYDLQLLKLICNDIGYSLLDDDRQVFGAIHYKNTDKIHCHYIFNYIGIDGTLYSQISSVYGYRYRVNQVLKKYGLNSIAGSENNILIA